MSTIIKIAQEELSIGKIFDLAKDVFANATSIFVKTVSEEMDDNAFSRADFEPNTVTEKEETLKELCMMLRKKFSLQTIAIFYRLGFVKPSEVNFVVAIGSKLKSDSLEALAYCVNSLEAKVLMRTKETSESDSANSEIPTKKRRRVEKIDSDLVQITASEDEVEERIRAFISRKRSEIDLMNVQEFCNRPNVDDRADNTCARTDSIVVRRTGSSSHLRKSTTVNASGPQTKPEKIVNSKEESHLPSGLKERLQQLEDHVFGEGRPVPKNVYDRLKALEDRVLFLEGISPEYFSSGLITSQSSHCDAESQSNRDDVINSLSVLNTKIEELRSKFVKKE